MRTLSLIIFFLITTIPVSAQQWVLDEIAEEHDSSESIPTWLVGVLLIIGFFVYKHLQRKDDEEQERRIKEQKYEEEQQLEEQLQKYREQHDDDIDFYEDDDNLIIPDIPSARIINKEPSATKSVSDESTIQSTPIETEFYTISADRKTFIKAKDTDSIIIPDGVEVIKFKAFMMRKIKSIVIPKSVKKIEDLAFSGCSVEKLVIPNSIGDFGELTFNGCDSLTDVIIEEGITKLGIGMFKNCMSLKSVLLPQSLLSIPDSAFEGCISLDNVTLPPNIKYIGFSAFRECGLKSINIPETLFGISEYMFYDAYDLKKVELPNTITCIMSHAFYGCKYLHIIIPPSVSYIAPDAFDQCNEYSYENLCIEVPKGKKEKLEQLNEHLKGKILEYDVTEDMAISSDLQEHKTRFIDFHIFKEKENLRNQEPMFYNGVQVAFRYENKCTYDNFE
ncbi:leucine-rich repeat domain-containing protein [Bacteroides clarus]|jgi:hypothetical protein|uniref:leucine-rich repeat domain-containing protein n=1 Tax=Bacteroides clarus TaxID=626929 RepID=UPI00397DF2C2